MEKAQLKFRGKLPNGGKWNYFDMNEYFASNEWDFTKFLEYQMKNICQFTGQKDANGNEIYEGDIVKTHEDWDTYKFQAGEINEVYFGFGGFRLKAKNPKAKGYWLEDGNDVVVIGNIFENPELLPNAE